MATGNTTGGVPTFEKLIRPPNAAPGPLPNTPERPPVIEPPDPVPVPLVEPRPPPKRDCRLKARSIARHRHNLALEFDRL
jgi:hypothetical protein